MKSRIFALILALCCLSLLLVACKDEACLEHVDANADLVCDTCGATIEVSTTEPETTTEEATEAPETVPPCDKHVDVEPADEYCDVCGANVVVVFLPSEPGETETRVEMEIVTAPADANPTDYIDLGEVKQPASSMEKETNGIDYEYVLNGDIVWAEEVETEIETVEDSPFEDETVVTVLGTLYNAIDLLTGKNIIPTISVPRVDFDYPTYSYHTDSANYTVVNNGFVYSNGFLCATNTNYDDHDTSTSYSMTFDGYAYLSLYYNINSEGGCDRLTVYRNDEPYGSASGSYTEGYIDLYVYAGDTVTLTYSKDGSVSYDNEYCRVSVNVSGSSTNISMPQGVTVDTYGYYFTVTKTVYTATEQTIDNGDFMDPSTEITYSVTIEKTAYTYTGAKIADATWTAKFDTDLYAYVSEDGTGFADSWKLEQYDDTRSAEYAYITYDGNIYLVKKETNELIPGGSALTFIDRPVFDYANDAYGYVVDGYTLYVYDLSQWLECVYTYTIPGFYEDVDTFLLENGNMLLQTYLRLPSDSVSFDIQTTDYKYDLVYILIDPTAKTATEVEFGYWINECVTDLGLFTEKATNVFVVFPINQSLIDYSGMTVLVVDNDLSILCQLPDLNYESLALFGSSYIRMYNDILDCYEILNTSFGFVTYVPGDAVFYDNYFTINGKLYTVADGKIQALETILKETVKGNYVIFDYSDLNMFIRETIKVPAENDSNLPAEEQQNYYIVTVGAKGFEISKIGKKTDKYYEEFYEVTDFGYVTKAYVYDDGNLFDNAVDNEASFLVFYNQNGVLLGTTQNTEVNLGNFQYLYCDENDGVYTLTVRYLDATYNYQSLTFVIQ